MVKSKKVKKHQKLSFATWQQLLIAVSVIAVAVLFSLSDLVFDGMTPAGGDVVSSKGKTNLMMQYEEKTGEASLWNPAIFSGMPMYHRYNPRSWSLDTFVNYFYKENSGQVIVYCMIGAIGMFFLLYSLNFSILISLFGALAFLLMPHYHSLWLAGHFSKFRAIMFIPWVIAGFLYFINRKNLFSLLLLTLAFSLQVRTQHYQIIFYTALILFALSIYPFIKLLIDKEYRALIKSVGLLGLGIILLILSVYQPLFVMKEYTPHSTRGGNPTHIENADPSAEKSKGVTFDYATQWSLSPKEMICFLIPRYFGGTSQEQYTGDAVPQLKGRIIPGYWGDMPFTSSTDYIGVALFILLIFGIYGFRKDWKIVSLLFFLAFALLLGFGRHFPGFYKIFFYYLPYFSKFRVPTMIMMAVFSVIVIMAAYGAKHLIESYKNENTNNFKVLYAIAGFFIVLTISPFLLKGMLSFSAPMEMGRYDVQVLNLFKEARFDLMKMDTLRTFFFALIVLGLIFSLLKRYISPTLFIIGIMAVTLLDVSLINKRYRKDLVPQDQFAALYFPASTIDKYLISQNEQTAEPFRILGLGGFFSDNHLAFYHQCIGGYDAAKLQTIQDLIDNNLYKGWETRFPLNWNVVNFLNGKYLIFDKMLSHENLRFIMKDEKSKAHLFENVAVLPRCFFVGQYEKLNNTADILNMLNQKEFDPSQMALLEKDLSESIIQPDSSSYAVVKKFTPNSIEIKAKSDRPCLLVLSEVYYPKGWRAHVDGVEKEIYKTNHILRSIVFPGGEHQVIFTFHPETYYNGKRIATAANIILLLAIVACLGRRIRISKR